MEATDLEEPKFTCVQAFKQRDHDKALQLLPNLQQPAAVRTSYNVIPPFKPNSISTDASLLHLAALNGWMDIVAILIDKYGCSSQCCDSQGQTPLHYAAYGGSLIVVKYLVTEQHCGPLDSCYGTNSLHYSCVGGCLELVKYLINEHHCDASFSNEEKVSLLSVLLSKQIDIVKYLITEKRYNPNSMDQKGMTLLHNAIHEDIEVDHRRIHYLVKELGCDPALPNKDNDMPIHIACLSGQLIVTQYLITEQHCDPNSRGKYMARHLCIVLVGTVTCI